MVHGSLSYDVRAVLKDSWRDTERFERQHSLGVCSESITAAFKWHTFLDTCISLRQLFISYRTVTLEKMVHTNTECPEVGFVCPFSVITLCLYCVRAEQVPFLNNVLSVYIFIAY